jgi:hypothetical protein
MLAIGWESRFLWSPLASLAPLAFACPALSLRAGLAAHLYTHRAITATGIRGDGHGAIMVSAGRGGSGGPSGLGPLPGGLSGCGVTVLLDESKNPRLTSGGHTLECSNKAADRLTLRVQLHRGIARRRLLLYRLHREPFLSSCLVRFAPPRSCSMHAGALLITPASTRRRETGCLTSSRRAGSPRPCVGRCGRSSCNAWQSLRTHGPAAPWPHCRSRRGF